MTQFKTALFSKTKHIGDSIILTAAINALPIEYKYVDIICLPDSEQVFLMCPRVRNIFVIPRNEKGFLKKAYSYFKLIRGLTQYKYNFFAQFSDDWRGALISRALSIELSVTRGSIKRGKIWHNSFASVCNVVRNNRPMAEQDTDLLRRVGLFKEGVAPSYLIKVPRKNLKEISLWLNQNHITKNSKFIVIHAFSRWSFKEISFNVWVDVINHLNKKNIKVVLSGSHQDYKKNIEIARRSDYRVAIFEDLSLADAAAIFSLSLIVISIDSMAIHLASALQKKVASIFGPTSEYNWAPWQTIHKIISLSEKDNPSFACRPCGKDGCGGSKVSSCLTEIKSDSILKEVFLMLDQNLKARS
jgi:heptosyltransferase-3